MIMQQKNIYYTHNANITSSLLSVYSKQLNNPLFDCCISVEFGQSDKVTIGGVDYYYNQYPLKCSVALTDSNCYINDDISSLLMIPFPATRNFVAKLSRLDYNPIFFFEIMGQLVVPEQTISIF